MDTLARPVRRRRKRSPMPPQGVNLPRIQRYVPYVKTAKRDRLADDPHEGMSWERYPVQEADYLADRAYEHELRAEYSAYWY